MHTVSACFAVWQVHALVSAIVGLIIITVTAFHIFSVSFLMLVPLVLFSAQGLPCG